MSDAVKFFVVGMPAPQGSKKFVGNGRMVESSKKVAPWRQDVCAAALADGGHCLGPVEVSLTFYLPRPASAPKSRVWPDRKPDADKLARSTLDALVTAAVIEDDARVVSLHAAKVYAAPGQPCGARVEITPLTVPDRRTRRDEEKRTA